MIVLFCLVGAFSLNNSAYDILVMLGFGVLGYLMRKLKYEGAPLVMAFVLGPLLESEPAPFPDRFRRVLSDLLYPPHFRRHSDFGAGHSWAVHSFQIQEKEPEIEEMICGAKQ